MFGTEQDAVEDEVLDLRNHPGDEPVWTAGSRREAEDATEAGAVDAPVSSTSPGRLRAAGLDLSVSPGDSAVFYADDPSRSAPISRCDRNGSDPDGGSDARQDATDADERGRDAEAPTEIPARGWLAVAKRVKLEARRDNLTLVSAGIAFYALLSLAPALAAIVSVYGLVSDPADVTRQINDVAGTMPAEARQILTDQLTAVAGASGASLGFGVVFGILVALWGASSAINQLLVALSLVNDEEETRGPVKLRVTALALTLGAIAFLVVVVLLIAALPAWLSNSPIGDGAATAVSIARWPVLLVLMLAALSFLYQVGPDRDRPRFRWVTPGAVIATVIWLVASAAFSFYASRFGSYNETYGAMGAVVVLMLFLYLTSLCVLLGAEINAELEHQTARDSTVGPERPLGERGAYVADTVATSVGSAT